MEKEEKIKRKRLFLFKSIFFVTVIALLWLIIVSYRLALSNMPITPSLRVPKPTIVFAGISKGIKPEQIRAIVRKLSVVGEELFSDYHFIIYDNDSPRVQQMVWKEVLGNGKGTFLSEPSDRSMRQRTQKIAHARNKMLDMVHGSEYGNYDYLWIQDLDGVCGGPAGEDSYSTAVFQKALDNNDKWDVLSFVYVPYWDMWAFRHPTLFPHNMYGRKASQNPPRKTVTKFIERNMLGPTSSEFMDVDSAFMMTAIHKMWTTKLSRYYHLDENGDPDCEHVAFYKGMKKQKQDIKIKLWPVVFCEGDPGYL